MSVFADHYGRHLLDNTRLYPGVLDVLARFQRIPAAPGHQQAAGLHRPDPGGASPGGRLPQSRLRR